MSVCLSHAVRKLLQRSCAGNHLLFYHELLYYGWQEARRKSGSQRGHQTWGLGIKTHVFVLHFADEIIMNLHLEAVLVTK